MRNKRHKNLAKRILSVLMAMALFSSSFSMVDYPEEMDNPSSVAYAAVDDYSKNPTLYSAQNFIDYSKAYREYPQNHYDDNIIINRSDDEAKTTFDGFLSLGTPEYPFAGTITFNASATHDINIDTAFFDYVYDYVTIDGGIDEGVEKHITFKPISDNSKAVFANHVMHDDGSKTGAVYGSGAGQKTPATWTIVVSGYEGTTHTHGSIIGEMGENAECTINITNNYSADVANDITVGNAGAITDTGAVCGVMQTGAKLTVAKMTGSAMTSVTASSGNAGGLVGTMNSGSTLTISGSSSDYVNPTSSITATSGYAGGLVGSNDQATVTGSYTAIKNTVTGSLGAGGLYGYYKPIMTNSAYSLDLNNFTIGDSSKKCTVSSPVGAGGFFGVLENPGGVVTLSGTNPVYVSGSGNNTIFGGVIGSYKADSIDDTLSVGGTASNTMLPINTNKSGDLSYYGGVVGNINGAYFAKISNVNINASNANDDFFGGAVACADTGYVYVNNLTLTASSYKGGAIVGHTTSGVVHIAGATNLSNAISDTTNSNFGQIVGYRDSALVFAESDWNLTRYIDSSTSKGAAADDVGSWGEVVRFKTSDFTISSILDKYYDPSAETIYHYAKLKAASTSLGSVSAFALAALNMQLNAGTTSTSAALQFADIENSKYSTLKNLNFTMTADIDLSLTGITGLTRDNSYDSWTSGITPEYNGASFDGGEYILTLAIGEGYEGQNTANSNTSGRGRIYRHRYNALFGILENDFTVEDLTVKGIVSTYTKTTNDFHVGTIAGVAKKKLNASNVIIGTVTNGVSDMNITFGIDNASGNTTSIYVGGLVGKMDDPGATVIGTGADGTGTAAYTGTTDSYFRADITGTSCTDSTYVGGIAGHVGNSSIKVIDVELGGKVENATASPRQRIGGLFAYVTGGSVDIDGVTANGLTVSGKMGTNNVNSDTEKSMGGLFGYCWDADSTFDHVNISSCTLNNNNSGGNMAGLINMGKGHWIFNSVDISGLTLRGSSAASLGMLVNKAYSGTNAMYLELPSGFTYTISSVSGTAPAIYDELAAYTVMPKNVIEANGNAVISINTNGTTRYGTMTASGEDATTVHMTTGSCNTYQNQVTSTGFNKYNPNSRYYYNVDNYIGETNSGAAALYLWSVYQYAQSSIKTKIASTAPKATFSGDLDLDGYSYYPVDVSGTVNISGNVALHNKDIEDRESESVGDSYARTTIKDTTNNSTTQHYLMHAGLFRNVSGTININGALTIDGTVPDTSTYCGALVCGTIGGSTSSDAKFTSNNTGASISLAGIKVHNKDNSYSPLLINKASGYVVMDIYHVSADSSAYSPNEQIATSLIGIVGSDTAEKVQVTFSDIQLDAREVESTLSDLTNVYGTKNSLFTRATLLESLTYASGSGSSGVYNYKYNEDWGSSSPRKVTYGKEISDSNSVNKGKEYYYYQNFGEASYFTNPYQDSTVAGLSAVYNFTGFKPYVAVWGASIKNSSTKHQLNVNHSAATFGGCGTYNHPFTLASSARDTSGGLETISLIIENEISSLGNTYTISLPDDITTPDTWCEDKEACAVYTFNGTDTFLHPSDSNKNKSLTDVRKYLARAYYYLSTDITIDDPTFSGLGSTGDTDAIFHGIIVGNGRTITNETTAPLIYASSGCVIKNLTIKPDGITLSVSTANSEFASVQGAASYGALIGRVFGGDNIIDQVTVDMTTANVTAGNHLATVGSYVGVVVEGGVFFRNMDKVKNNVLFSGGAFAESDKGHLYCNPYIGRVISGFAVNETASDDEDTYAPYESGTRTFGDGTPVSGNQVSLQNNNKNYSITDLDPDLGKLTASSTTVEIPNSQAFFIMSLIINCGMGTNGEKVVGYYSANQLTRHANYSAVGTNIKVSDYKTEENTDAEAKAAFEATDDYLDYAKTANDTSTSPYLISAYTTGSYAKQLGSNTGFTLNVNDDIILPDGYKGIGNVFNSNTKLYIALSTFNGNNKTISQNTTFYTYSNVNNKDQDNYLPYTKNASGNNTVHGLGLFNYVNNATFQDCILTGNVIVRQYHSGNVLDYTASTNYASLSAGSLAGTLNMDGAATVSDVYLNNVYVESTRETGGMIGYLINDGNSITITNKADTANSTTYQSSKIYVNAGTSAAGLIARQGKATAGQSDGRGDISIDLNNHYFNFTSIVSRYTESSTDSSSAWNADWALGVGGLVGIARGNNSGNNANNISISNVKIGTDIGDSLRTVSCERIDNGTTDYGDIYVGGLVGVFNRCPVTITSCEIYNVNVASNKYAGGLVGWGGTDSEITIDSCTLSNTLTAKVFSSSSNAGGVLGFCKYSKDTDRMGNFTVKNSTIDGYTIEGSYSGGALGDWKSSSDKSFKIQDSVISNCTIKYTSAGGGIAGQLQKNLNGYNVRVSDITFTKKDNTTSQGYVCGNRNGGIIKIAGFHRTGTISEAKIIGNNTDNQMTNMYGSGGFVIFADYEGASTQTPQNDTPSSVNLGNVTRVDGFGASPYVTINPEITLDNNIGLITGDGMSIPALNSILTDTSNKKYAVAGRADIGYFLNNGAVKSDIVSTFKTELGDTVKNATYDFPMLVINNTATADEVLNHYLRALTNTDNTIDFSYRNGNDQASKIKNDANFGVITIRKCNYSNGTITVSNNNDASLIVNSSNNFQIKKTNNKEQYDTATPGQFTLLDVAFKDPTTSSSPRVVYHLYVPVIVKKLLEYNFDISSVSGSTYDQSLYSNNRGNNVVENLGAPVTMEFEYNYLRSAADWALEDNDYKLDKYLSFDQVTTAAFDANTTKMILVDVNRGGKEYYLDKWSDGYDSNTELLNLQAFKDVDGNSFYPLTYEDMLSAQNITGTETLKEKYYLTVFTNKYTRTDPNEVKVIHYSVTSPNIGTTDHPTRRIDCADQVVGSYHYVTHLVIGDFYTNTISVLTPANATERMSNSNKTITVNISASIDLVNSGTRRLLRDYLGKSNVTIYQSLLASFEKYNNNTLYDKGLTAIDGYSISSYTLTGQNGNIPITEQKILRTANFIEFQNNTDISGSLQNGSVTSTVQAILEFNSEKTRNAQFPYRSSGQNTGALVLGYSNISSNKTNTAYSVVSVGDDDLNNKMYYVETEETAELQYYADYSNADKQNQLNEQLGINAREIESNQTKSFIQTEGRYDTTGLLNADKAEYLECSIKLYQKQENGSYSEVSIDSYLDSLSVISEKTPVYSNSSTHTYVFDIDDVEQFENEQYVYKIPITFNALTGNKTNFKDTYLYANYKVELTVSLFDHDGSTDNIAWSDHMGYSNVSDWVIYTNARVYTDLINTSN